MRQEILESMKLWRDFEGKEMLELDIGVKTRIQTAERHVMWSEQLKFNSGNTLG